MLKKRNILYFIIFLNSFLAFINTSICLLSDSWVLVKPLRILFVNQTQILSEKSLFQDTNSKCAPLNGIIEFGLFKGTWLLNYGYGCRKHSKKISSKF